MEHILDLHIHSKYAYATSKDMDLAGIYYWAKLKGISIIGTGDCTHPAWARELESKLVELPNGLLGLSPKYAQRIEETIPQSCRQELCFIPTVEVSVIYSSDDKVRKIHYIIVLPDLAAMRHLNKILATKGNLVADGRPTFGMNSVELLKIVQSISDKALLIPAHAWTPWFGVFGSKSGFDSLAEVFEELSDQIYAIETGLSSDPEMNWQINQLRNTTLVSFSDAHSPRKLGREATIINCDLSYLEVIQAITTNDERLVGTIEFFPQEGKYHLDGHRKCQFSCQPEETARLRGVCPVCGKQLTVGVLSRVNQLTQQEDITTDHQQKLVEYIIPLAEILAAQSGIKSTTAKTIESLYQQLLSQFGNEFSILRKLDLQKLDSVGYDELATNIRAMRESKIDIVPGYDGEYGKIQLPQKISSGPEQLDLGF